MMVFFDSPYFGILLSILFFELGLLIYKKTKISFCNPLLLATSGMVAFLLIFDIDVAYYDRGGSLILFFLGPATVILAVPLYKQLDLLKKHFIPILAGIFVGCITAIVSVISFARLFGINQMIEISLMPKSVTTPIGIELSKQLGGIQGITVVAIVITGILGAVIAPIVCKIFKIENPVARGIAIGTASHAGGTTKAVEMGETEGAMSGLAIGIAGIITALIAPIIVSLL